MWSQQHLGVLLRPVLSLPSSCWPDHPAGCAEIVNHCRFFTFCLAMQLAIGNAQIVELESATRCGARTGRASCDGGGDFGDYAPIRTRGSRIAVEPSRYNVARASCESGTGHWQPTRMGFGSSRDSGCRPAASAIRSGIGHVQFRAHQCAYTSNGRNTDADRSSLDRMLHSFLLSSLQTDVSPNAQQARERLANRLR
jgi:hypothetical protein